MTLFMPACDKEEIGSFWLRINTAAFKSIWSCVFKSILKHFDVSMQHQSCPCMLLMYETDVVLILVSEPREDKMPLPAFLQTLLDDIESAFVRNNNVHFIL